jgi:uncharacterized protein (DUF58 family)
MRLAAASAYALLELGHRVGAAVYTDVVRQFSPPGRGPRQFLRICSLLAAGRPTVLGASAHLASCRPQLAGASAALVISDFLTDDETGLGRALRGIAARCSDPQAIQLQNTAEMVLPRGSHFELIDSESGASSSWHADEGGSRQAVANATAHRNWLAGTCTAAGIRFSSIDIASSWQSALLRHFATPDRR